MVDVMEVRADDLKELVCGYRQRQFGSGDVIVRSKTDDIFFCDKTCDREYYMGWLEQVIVKIVRGDPK